VLLSFGLNAVAACSMLRKTHRDKWSAAVPVMKALFAWVTSNPSGMKYFLETFPPITSNQNIILPDQEGAQ